MISFLLFVFIPIFLLVIEIQLMRQEEDITFGILFSLFVLSLIPFVNIIIFAIFLKLAYDDLEFSKKVIFKKKGRK